MASRRRCDDLHHQRLRAALAAAGQPIPPGLRRRPAQPPDELLPATYADLADAYQRAQRQIARYQRLFQRLKDCRGRTCTLCATCVHTIWVAAARKGC